MTEQEIIIIERACERLILDFAFFSDHQHYEALGGLFAGHGTMTRPTGELLDGREAIINSYKAKPRERMTRHICTNIRIHVESSDSARGFTYALVVAADSNQKPNAHFGIQADERQLAGEFEDRFLRTPEGWRFAARTARFVMFMS